MKFRYPRRARVNPRIGAESWLRPGLWAACRRRAGRAGQVCQCKQLRAFASVCKHLRAFASVCERARSRLVAFSRSRLVAFSRANFFFGTGTFGRVLSYRVVSCRHFSSFFVISRHSSSQNLFFRVWRATGGCGIGWAGRAVLCCAWFPRRGQDVHHVMIFISNWFATAAGPRLRSFILRTIVLQNRGVCSCWESQGASQYGGVLACSEGAGLSAVVRTGIHAVDSVRMIDTVDGAGSGDVFIHEKQANCGSIVPTGNLHRSPLGPVLRQAWEPNAIAGTRSPRLGCTPWQGHESDEVLERRPDRDDDQRLSGRAQQAGCAA